MPETLKFERTMQLFFGDKAYGIAGSANNPKDRKKWLLKLIKEILKRIDNLDTSLEHKKLMMISIESLQNNIENNEAPTWRMIYELFRFCGYLLGHVLIHEKPIILYSLSYHQDENQYFTEHMLKDIYPLKTNKLDAITIRSKLAQQLKSEGLSEFKIGLILNISEYQVKKLLKLVYHE